jgi:hypothetical protein
MRMRLVHLWSARAHQAVLRRLSSDMRPQRTAYFTCHRMTWWSSDTLRDFLAIVQSYLHFGHPWQRPSDLRVTYAQRHVPHARTPDHHRRCSQPSHLLAAPWRRQGVDRMCCGFPPRSGLATHAQCELSKRRVPDTALALPPSAALCAVIGPISPMVGRGSGAWGSLLPVFPPRRASHAGPTRRILCPAQRCADQ